MTLVSFQIAIKIDKKKSKNWWKKDENYLVGQRSTIGLLPCFSFSFDGFFEWCRIVQHSPDDIAIGKTSHVIMEMLVLRNAWFELW